eukprot:m51a1_g12094 hypothetical protein (483) ;mRNA; f:4222-5734
MPIDYHTFVEALPVHQSPRVVLQVLRYRPEQLPMRNSYLAPDVLVAVCRLLHCDDDALDTAAAPSPEALWQRLDSRRDQWLPLLPAEDPETENALHLLADPVAGLSWARTAALSLLLGMHPRVGRQSPLGLLGPALLHQVFAEHLTAPVAAVAYCGPEGGLHVALVGPGGRTRELQPPPLGDASSRSSRVKIFFVQLVAHTEQTVVVAAGPQSLKERSWVAVYAYDSLKERSWVAVYAYDVRSGELVNAFSAYGDVATSQICFCSATGRVAFLSWWNRARADVVVVSLAGDDSTGPALVVQPEEGFSPAMLCASVSGRHVYCVGYDNIAMVDVLTGHVESSPFQGPASYLLQGHQALPDSLEDAVRLNALLDKDYCDCDDELFLVDFDPQSGEVRGRKWSRTVDSLLRSTNSYSIQGDYAFAVQVEEGTLWLRCLHRNSLTDLRSWAICQNDGQEPCPCTVLACDSDLSPMDSFSYFINGTI